MITVSLQGVWAGNKITWIPTSTRGRALSLSLTSDLTTGRQRGFLDSNVMKDDDNNNKVAWRLLRRARPGLRTNCRATSVSAGGSSHLHCASSRADTGGEKDNEKWQAEVTVWIGSRRWEQSTVAPRLGAEKSVQNYRQVHSSGSWCTESQ